MGHKGRSRRGWEMRPAILGAGGVGGLVGGAIAKAGHPVTLLVRPARRDHYPERLTVQSETLGAFEAPVQVADRLEGQFDVVWVTVKAMALEATLDAVPLEKLGGGVVVPLLNGVDHVGRLRERYGPERVLPGTIRVEAEQVAPGRVRHLSAFADVQVAPDPTTRVRAEALCGELRAAGLGCEVRDDELTMLWGKLCFLAPFALATTASGGPRGRGRRGCQGSPRAYPRDVQRVARRVPELDAKGRCGRPAAGARRHRGTRPARRQRARHRRARDPCPRGPNHNVTVATKYGPS